MARKTTQPRPYAKPDQIRIEGNKIFSPVRQKLAPLMAQQEDRRDASPPLPRASHVAAALTRLTWGTTSPSRGSR